MTDIAMTEILAVWFGAFVVALAVIWLVGLLSPTQYPEAHGCGTPECHFLFRSRKLVDHDASALWPEEQHAESDDWSRFRHWLEFRFGDLPDDPGHIVAGETLSFTSRLDDDAARLDLVVAGETLRATLIEGGPSCAANLHERRRQHLMSHTHGTALRTAPDPVWIVDRHGELLWQNVAATSLLPGHAAKITAALSQPPDTNIASTRRIRLSDANGNGDERWLDLTFIAMDSGHAIHACDVSALVNAKAAQRDFVQTLGRTFADLPTGLVVFDRFKTLALFNPALIDLTGLPADFLSTRPGIMTFFDMLRDAQVMPEPKNYANWRSQITDMINAARGGLYQECWSLVTGQTYRVTGRPHPNGAVAFLFEDITLEISELRHHRIEMSLRQAAFDHLKEAIAVLSPDHRLLFCNAGFDMLLGIDPDSSFAETGLSDLLDACQKRFPKTAFWSEVESTIVSGSAVSRSVTLAKGAGQLDLRLSPLGQGNTMLSLCHHAAQDAAKSHESVG